MAQQVVKKLSATKQKLSLGEVKKTEKANATNARKIIRTTVINPDEIEWPYISEEDEKELVNCLICNLQILKLPNNSVPLSVISKTEKAERRRHRRKWKSEQALESGFDVAKHTKLRKDVSIGVNCVSTSMERDQLSAVIIDKDVDPLIITKMLIPIARSKNVHIVAISGFSKTCQNVFRTRCIAMGLKINCCETNHPLYQIYSMISSIAIKESQDGDASSFVVPSGSNEGMEVQNETTIVPSLCKVDDEKVAVGQKRNMSSTEFFKPVKIRKV